MSRQISSADRVGNSALSTVATLNLANRHGAAGSESGTRVIAALASRAVRDPLTLCDSILVHFATLAGAAGARWSSVPIRGPGMRGHRHERAMEPAWLCLAGFRAPHNRRGIQATRQLRAPRDAQRERPFTVGWPPGAVGLRLSRPPATAVSPSASRTGPHGGPARRKAGWRRRSSDPLQFPTRRAAPLPFVGMFAFSAPFRGNFPPVHRVL